MAVVNHTGAQATSTWDTVADEHHLTGACTAGAGVVITITTGASANPIRFDGDYQFTFSSTASLLADATAANHIRWQPNGAATTWVPSGIKYIFLNANTGTVTLDFNDFHMISVLYDLGNSTSSATNLRFNQYGWNSVVFRTNPTAGTHTISNIEIHASGVTGYTFAPGGGTTTVTNVYVWGAVTGASIAPTGGTNSISGLKLAYCGAPIVFGGTAAVTMTNVSIIESRDNPSGALGASSTITRMFCIMRGSDNGGAHSPGVGVAMTFEEAYISGGVYKLNNSSGTATRVVVQNSVLADPGMQYVASPSPGLIGCTSSGNDVLHGIGFSQPGISGGTSDNDYIAGNRLAQIGSAPSPAEGPVSDFADANFAVNVDTDSGNTTSTSTPVQYASLASSRTNARATPNKPLTTSAESPSVAGYTFTLTYTTGIKARSRLLIGTSAGVTRANATHVTPWKYGGILDPEMVDFTLPVTSHSHSIDIAPGTYFYRSENYDPCGRRFLGPEASFTVAAPAGGAARSAFAGAGMRVA